MDDGMADKRRRPQATETRAWRAAAEDGTAGVTSGGATAYDRRRVLPRLIGCDPREFDGKTGDALGRAIRARLTRALRAERRRGRAGHWAYDLNRHLALVQAIAGEAALSEDGRAAGATPPLTGRERGPGTQECRPAEPDGA